MTIVVRAPRHKLFFLFVLSAGMVAGSAWLMRFHWALFPIKVVGLLGVLFFGLCGGWILSKLFSHRISLILDRDGLLDNSSALPAGRIPWDQIARMGIAKVENQRFLGIDVRDRTLLPSSMSAFRRWAEDFNTAVSGYPLGIPSTTIDRTLEELHDLIARYWKDPKARLELGEPGDPTSPKASTANEDPVFYRWATSLGLFLGGLTTFLVARELLFPRLKDYLFIWFVATSLMGICVSLIAMAMHPSKPDPENLLNHRAAAFIAIGMNLWPWAWILSKG